MEFFSCPESRTYLCYAYGRLSKKDAEKARRENDESNSIKNQRDLIHEYIDRHPDLTLCMEGYDDNYTGTNFDRPHFQEMMQAVEAGKVNCIIVKDSCGIIGPNQKGSKRLGFSGLVPSFLTEKRTNEKEEIGQAEMHSRFRDREE